MSKTILSKVIGELTQDDRLDDQWNSEPIAIPFLDGQKVTIVLYGFEQEDQEAIEKSDAILQHFFELGKKDREAASDAIYKNCMENVEFSSEYLPNGGQQFKELKDVNEIWQFVQPMEIYVELEDMDDPNKYVVVSCACDWEEEHGLQLVFREGKKLTRVSYHDGDMTDNCE